MDRASKILNGLALSKPQRRFLATLFTAILITRGKINLRNLARYSAPSEKTYARQFARPMDWVAFNRALINQTLGSTGERVVAFDPSFLPKAGKHTFGRAAFWHGSHSRLEQGLEVSVLAVIDVVRHQALTLSVRQTQPVDPADEATLIDQYVEHIRQVWPQLEAAESYLCVDGGLARRKLLDGVCALGGHLIGKLRRDARLRYLYAGPPRPGRGRQKVYDGPVDWADHSRLEGVGHDGSFYLYTAVLNHAHFQRNLRIVRLVPLPTARCQAPILLFSTDTQLDPWTIYRYYQARFQIELLFRDAKQFTGLTEGQIRDKARLDFHFNASLTTLNLAKAQLLEGQPADQPASCSIATLKAHYFNEHYLNRFIAMFGLDPTSIKNHPHYQTLRDYGKIAA